MASTSSDPALCQMHSLLTFTISFSWKCSWGDCQLLICHYIPIDNFQSLFAWPPIISQHRWSHSSYQNPIFLWFTIRAFWFYFLNICTIIPLLSIPLLPSRLVWDTFASCLDYSSSLFLKHILPYDNFSSALLKYNWQNYKVFTVYNMMIWYTYTLWKDSPRVN